MINLENIKKVFRTEEVETWVLRVNLLSELNKEGATIIMVTHSQHDAAYADRIINLYDGQIVNHVDL